DIIFLEQRRVNPQHLHLELARQSDADQPTTGLAGCLQCGNFILHGLEPGLHFLCLAHQAEEIFHRPVSLSVLGQSLSSSEGSSGSSASISPSCADGASGMRTSITLAPGKRARMAATAGSLRASRNALSRRAASSSARVSPPSSLE